jgi:RNA polymerase sigma-70 factor, ECF subfamily
MTESRSIPAHSAILGAAASADVREAELTACLSRLAGGDLDALGAIYDAWGRDLYAAALWRTGSPADASDAVQDVFVKLATTRAKLAAVRRPKRYLLGIAHRAAIDRVRARRGDGPLDDAAFLESPSADPARAGDARRLSAALAQLPAPQREVVYLHEVQGLPFREVGSVTGVPTFTAASRYRLAIARLRTILGVEL